MRRRLTRSQSNRVIGGVCGGLGSYLGIDPAIIRVFFVLLALGDGLGVWLYLALWILIPVEGGPVDLSERARAVGDEMRETLTRPDRRTLTVIGVTLILLGAVSLLNRLGLPFLRWLDFKYLWPSLLIIAGFVLVFRRAKGE